MSDRLELARMAFLQLNRTERREFIRTFADATPTAPAAPEPERIVRRDELAQRFGRSTRWADRMAAEGHIRKVTIPGRRRAMGFRASDVAALLAGGR